VQNAHVARSPCMDNGPVPGTAAFLLRGGRPSNRGEGSFSMWHRGAFRPFSVWTLAVVAVSVSAAWGQARNAQPKRAVPYDVLGGPRSDQILVKVSDEAAKRLKRTRRAGTGRGSLPPQSALQANVQQTLARWNIQRFRRAYPLPFAHPEIAAKHGLDRYYVGHVPHGTDTIQMAIELQAVGGDIESASVSTIGGIAQFIPNDTEFSRQYGMHNTRQAYGPFGERGTVDADIDAPEAWALHTGRPGTVTIAIIDSGVGPHPDLDDRLLVGANINDGTKCSGGPFNGLNCFDDNDCLGFPCDFMTNTSDVVGHGTHVAGIAAAQGNNAFGVAGVSWGANVLPVRVVDEFSQGSPDEAAVGLMWAVDHGAEICNLSLRYLFPTPNEKNFFQLAVNYANDNGVLVVAAAGNESSSVTLPGNLVHVFTVAATTADDTIASFSNFGPEVDVAAPGNIIYSTIPPDEFGYINGTSMASPHVAGLAALIKSYAYYLTADEIKSLIISTVDDLGAPGWDEDFGHGRINAGAALAAVTPSIAIVSSDPPNDAIDARQPSDPIGANPAGWQSVKIQFDGDATGLTTTDFDISVDPAGAPVPGITSVSVDGSMVTVDLDSAIPVEAWTIVTHQDSNTHIRIGYLPGDVNNDRVANASDILAVIDSLNHIGDPLPIWQTDIDRSGMDTNSDILRVIDLLNGAGSYTGFLGATLPD